MATETRTYAASGCGSPVAKVANHTQPSSALPRRVYFSPTQQECLRLNRRIGDDNQMANTESSSKLGHQAVDPYSQMQLANPSMAIKKPTEAATRKRSNPSVAVKKASEAVVTKKRTFAAANATSGCGSSVAMTEVPPHGADHIQAPPPLPPGVYFSPTRDECLGFLNQWIAGDKQMADARGYIFDANVYGERPEALAQRFPPASIRGRGEHAWWFMSETRFQSQTVGGGASKRADRRVEAGGFWRLEQGKEKLKKGKEKMEQDEEEEEADGVKNCFGYYVGPRKKEDKTPWLMQEFTSANGDGAGKLGVPALYRVYVTPRATRDQQERIFGEHHVKKGLDGKKLPARAMVQQEYFDDIAQLLPEGSVRGVVAQEDIQAPPASPGLLGDEFMADAPSDNLSMPMDDFLRLLDEQPAVEMVEGGEPNWKSLTDILDADEFMKFN